MARKKEIIFVSLGLALLLTGSNGFFVALIDLIESIRVHNLQPIFIVACTGSLIAFAIGLMLLLISKDKVPLPPSPKS